MEDRPCTSCSRPFEVLSRDQFRCPPCQAQMRISLNEEHMLAIENAKRYRKGTSDQDHPK